MSTATSNWKQEPQPSESIEIPSESREGEREHRHKHRDHERESEHGREHSSSDKKRSRRERSGERKASKRHSHRDSEGRSRHSEGRERDERSSRDHSGRDHRDSRDDRDRPRQSGEHRREKSTDGSRRESQSDSRRDRSDSKRESEVDLKKDVNSRKEVEVDPRREAEPDSKRDTRKEPEADTRRESDADPRRESRRESGEGSRRDLEQDSRRDSRRESARSQDPRRDSDRRDSERSRRDSRERHDSRRNSRDRHDSRRDSRERRPRRDDDYERDRGSRYERDEGRGRVSELRDRDSRESSQVSSTRDPERSLVLADTNSQALVPIQPTVQSAPVDLEEYLPTQGSMVDASQAAKKATAEMEKRILERRERMDAWRREKRTGDRDETAGTVGKAWNLEDDDDHGDIEGVEDDIIHISQDVLNSLDFSVKTEEIVPDKPKRTAVFGGKKVIGKKNAIVFGLKSIVKQSPLPTVNIFQNEDEFDSVLDSQDLESADIVMKDSKNNSKSSASDSNEEVIADSLDSFMLDIHLQVEEKTVEDQVIIARQKKIKPEVMARALKEEPSDDEVEEDQEVNPLPITVPINTSVDINQADIFAAAAAKSASKKKEIVLIDHTKVEYEPFRKDFFMEPPEVAALTKTQVDQIRLDLEGIVVRGKNCPKPIRKWTQFGMPNGVLEIIKKVLVYEAPTPIQAQAIPAIMSGRDVIGIAKTGSGKTIAFLLPMFRHIKDQRPAQGQEGPIALVMTPTRELALQIFRECKHFSKSLGIRVSCCYGGSPIRDQIAELRRGADIIICTPGRMIDLLCANGGRVTNLKRVSYLVLDEADRMFDLGFEPQVMKMVDNIRPDRQTVLFSATFPRFMEALARRVLKFPLEILVGARSMVAPDVTQIVQVHADDESKFLRLLAILGKTSSEDPSAKYLVFVDRQEAADTMMSNLMKRGYPCLSLHGGKDQADRDSVISDFKNDTANILIATSVAARGLDVKDLKVVVNYECPNHLEDYVHRCGRTGRAGNKGTAYTFIMPEQAQYAGDIVKALNRSKVPIPEDLKELAEKQSSKVKLGFARIAGSGFGGRGLGRLEGDRDTIRRIQLKGYGGDLAGAAEEDEKEKEKAPVKLDEHGEPIIEVKPIHPDIKPISLVSEVQAITTASSMEKAIANAKERNARLNAMLPAEKARALAIDITKQRMALQKVATSAAHWDEVEINDYPQKARWKVTSKEQISRISATSNCAITSRGVYVIPGKQPGPADFQHNVDRAKQEIKDLLTEATMNAMDEKTASFGGRYTVV